jgi:peroxiredoxin
MDHGKWSLPVRALRRTIAGIMLTAALPGAFAADLAIGGAMPAFSLTSTDGKTVSSQDFADKKAVVVVFTDNKCTYSLAYQSRLILLEQDYAGKGVQFVLINPNIAPNEAAARLDEMKAHAAEMKYPFPYLADPTQGAAHAFGATRTPEAFVFGPDHTLVYRGQIDDNTEEKMVHKADLKLALDAILSGDTKAIEKPVTTPFGCSIKWNK